MVSKADLLDKQRKDKLEQQQHHEEAAKQAKWKAKLESMERDLKRKEKVLAAKETKVAKLLETIELKSDEIDLSILARQIISKFPKTKTYAPHWGDVDGQEDLKALKAWKAKASEEAVKLYTKRGIIREDYSVELQADVAALLPMYFERSDVFITQLREMIEKKYPQLQNKIGSIITELEIRCPMQYMKMLKLPKKA